MRPTSRLLLLSTYAAVLLAGSLVLLVSGKGKHATTAKVKAIEIRLTENMNNVKDGEVYIVYTLSTNQRVLEKDLSPALVI